MSETEEPKVVRRSMALALGTACIILIAGLGGAMAYYTVTINNKDNEVNSQKATISQLNATIKDQNNTINQLNSNVTNLQSQVTFQDEMNAFLNTTATFTTLNEINVNSSAWVNKTGLVEGVLIPANTPSFFVSPFNSEITYNGTTIGVSVFGIYEVISGLNVFVLGVLTEGRPILYLADGSHIYEDVVYFINAQRIVLS